MKLLRTLLFLGLGALVTMPFSTGISAASPAGFNAGKIMDDSVMTNSSSMSVAQIQAFLSSKVPSCDTSGSKNSEMNNSGVPDYNGNGSIQRWEWGKARYGQTTFPCLKDYTQGGKKAAQIIRDVSIKYSINPQTLIVLLQKEQGLVTDTWPLNIQYRSATGYGCPDTAPCDSQYYGLTNQLDWAAKMFRSVISRSPNWYSPYFKGTNPRVYWHPDTGRCGSQSLTIANWTTAALYDYTPYRPNQAALNAGYGTGDSCSSYGNRNFYLYFTDWFGTTSAPNYAAQFAGQSTYPALDPGASANVHISFKNTGNQTWYDITTASTYNRKSTKLAALDPTNRSSIFANSSWHNAARPSATFTKVFNADGIEYSTNPHTAKPGETVQFNFTMTAPSTASAGVYKEVFGIVEEGGYGVVPMPVTPWLNITINKKVSASFVTQSAYPTIKPGQTISDNFITFKNTGNVNWYDNQTAAANAKKPIRLATMAPLNRTSNLGDASWGSGKNRPTGLFQTVYNKAGTAYGTNPHVVKPGESAKFQFSFTAPDNVAASVYREDLGLVEDGGVGTVSMPITPWINVTTTNESTARPAQSSHSISVTKTTAKTHRATFKNTGTTTWDSATTTLKILSGTTEGLHDSSWLNTTTPARLVESSVPPGGVGSFDIDLKPTNAISAGQYKLKLSPAINDTPISISDYWLTVNVQNPLYNATYYNQSPHPTVLQNATRDLTFRFKNTSNVNWYDKTTATAHGASPTVLMSTNPTKRISKFNANFANPSYPADTFARVLEGNGSTLAADQHIVKPGEVAEFTVTVTAPDSLKPGTYQEFFQPAINSSNVVTMGSPAWTNITVQNSNNAAQFYKQSAFPTIQRGVNSNAYFYFKNVGNSVWINTEALNIKGLKRVTLATTNPINRSSKFGTLFTLPSRPTKQFDAVYKADGTTPASDQNIVNPGEVARFSFTLKAPADSTLGVHREMFQPILEGGDPWTMNQTVWLDITVE